MSPRSPRRNTADFPRSKFVDHHVSTRSLPSETSKSNGKSKKRENKKDPERESSSEESEKEDDFSSPANVSCEYSTGPPLSGLPVVGLSFAH